MLPQETVNEKIEAAHNILWAFRKKALNNMVTNYNPNISVKLFEEENDIEVKQKKSRRCLFRNGEGFRVNWDLLFMALAVSS